MTNIEFQKTMIEGMNKKLSELLPTIDIETLTDGSKITVSYTMNISKPDKNGTYTVKPEDIEDDFIWS